MKIGEEINGIFEHLFEKLSDGTPVNIYANGIMEGNYVVISTDTRPAIASGFVTDLTITSISVTLDRYVTRNLNYLRMFIVFSKSFNFACTPALYISILNCSFFRNVNKKYLGSTFHIDTYDSNSISSFNLTSLSLLLEVSPRASELRKIIVDKLPPTFKKTLPKIIATKGKTILKRLNIVQQRAVLRAIAAEDYFLIKGMPGTGKESLILYC